MKSCLSPLTRWPCAVALVLCFALPIAAAAPPVAPRNPDQPEVWREQPTHTVHRAAISPDGKIVTVRRLGSEGPITFFHRDSVKEFWKLTDSDMYLFAFTPDGKHFLTHESSVAVHEVATRKTLRTFDIRAPSFGLDEKRYGVGNEVLVAVDKNGLISSYDLRTGKHLGDFANKDHHPMMVALSKDGKWLLTVGKKDELWVWDVQKRKLFSELREHTAPVMAIAISADGKWCASATRGKRLYVFDREKESERARTEVLLLRVSGLFFSPDGKTLLATGDGAHHGLNVWDWQASKEIRGGLPSQKVIDRILGDERFTPKEWNRGSLQGLGITDGGELLTREGSPRSRNACLLRVWPDVSLKKPLAPKHEKPSNKPKPKE